MYLKFKSLFFVCMFLVATISCSNRSIDNKVLFVLNDQVDAFNKRDVDRLVNNVTDDFKWYSIASNEILLETAGKENFRNSMAQYYNSRPPIHSKIAEYAIDGNRISFKEIVSHKNKNGKEVSSSAMGVYEIRKGKIFRAWYFID